ncbi:hypothetical protein B9Z65_4313 [Elsinoe australis]|uniref:Uncharacterized protein n=1 Tax=Elsinoe australis TaxID=40998 RepID=A0A2P7Z2F6_9PEZI|nr:hypothetical protein B9Z65_4313 [Elsinoe australis]
MADQFIDLGLGQVHEQVSSEPTTSESANSQSMEVEQPSPPEESAMDVDESERALQVGPSDAFEVSDRTMCILSLLALYFRENETAYDESFTLAVLCMWFSPNRDTIDEWSDDIHASTKLELAYMSILKYRSNDKPLTFWMCTSFLLTLHSLVKFTDESVWIQYLITFRGGRRIDDMGLFSKACWARLATLTCSRDLSQDLLPHEDYDHFSVGFDSPLDVSKAIRPANPDFDVLAKQPQLLDSSEVLFERTERDGKHYTVICSKGSKIVFVKKPGEEYTALLGDPRVGNVDTVWKLVWTKNFTMNFNDSLDLRGTPGLKEMETIFHEAAFDPSRAEIQTSEVPDKMFFGTAQ